MAFNLTSFFKKKYFPLPFVFRVRKNCKSQFLLVLFFSFNSKYFLSFRQWKHRQHCVSEHVFFKEVLKVMIISSLVVKGPNQKSVDTNDDNHDSKSI